MKTYYIRVQADAKAAITITLTKEEAALIMKIADLLDQAREDYGPFLCIEEKEGEI